MSKPYRLRSPSLRSPQPLLLEKASGGFKEEKTPSLLFVRVVAGLLVGYVPVSVAAEGTRISPVLDRIQAKKELVVGTAASMPPFNMTTKDGHVGLEIDLARIIAGSMNVQLTLKTIHFNDLLPALDAGQVDTWSRPR